ncbi:MAG: hypothetical protein Q9164_006868, partial [Protoblastenia rupestris]
DGSYENPGLFATAETNTAFQKCEIVYIPYFKKYFQYGDICAQCATDFGNGLTKVDLWIGSNPESSWTDQSIPESAKRGECQTAWGSVAGKDIIQNPATDLEVQSKFLGSLCDCTPLIATYLFVRVAQPLDDGTTCYNSDTSRFFPSNAGTCSGGGSDDSSPSPPASSSSSSSSALPSGPTYTDPPSNIDPPSNDGPFGENKAFVIEESKPSSTSAPATPPSPSPTFQAPSTVEKAAVVDNEGTTDTENTGTESNDEENVEENSNDVESNSEGTPSTTATTSSSAPSTMPSASGNSTGEAGDPCPVGGWFPGCVWGSGKGKLGDSCTGKSDCKGDWICVARKCTDNTRKINPFTLIIALPPATLGDLASIDIDKSCAWAFRISFQVLRLSSTHEQHHNGICHQNHDYDRAKSCNKNLFQIRPWTQMFFNEGSSIPVYSLYEYYEYSIPSFIYPNNIHGLKTLTSHLQHLTTFEYVAVFPFGQTDDICRLLHHLRNLRILRTQLAPKGRDLGLDTAGGAPNVVDIVEHAGHGEPKDLWMEFENSYRIFHHWIILAENGLQHLQRFEILDYANEGLRETLNTLFPVNLMPGWANQGGGIWVKQVIN